MARDYITEAIDLINETKKDGSEFFTKITIPVGLKSQLVNRVRQMGYLLYEERSGHYVVSWMGSREWLKMKTGSSSYDKNRLMKVLIPEIIETIEDKDILIKFLYPNVQMKLEQSTNENTQESEYICTNAFQVGNQLFSIVSKIK